MPDARLLPKRRPSSLPIPLLAVLAGFAGWGLAEALGSGDLSSTWWYVQSAALLLAIGLYGSTYGIDLTELREHLGTVVLAVTMGVLIKATLIAGVMYLAFGDPRYIVLGIAVAQIDPLSVAAMRESSRMSERAKTLLSAWASFDDPMTVLLTIYFSAFALHLADDAGAAESALGRAGTGAYVADIALNLLLLGIACAIWIGMAPLRGRVRDKVDPAEAARVNLRVQILAVCLLVILVAVAANQFLMLGLALAGLFFRPALDKVVDRTVQAAFLLAAFALGLLLVQGFSPVEGLVLGCAAFLAQVVVGALIPTRLRGTDRVYLALGQQNGITAVILALTLQPDFPQTVGIVAPAIITVNLLHYAANALWNRRTAGLPEPETPLSPAPAGPPRPSADAADRSPS